MPRPRLSVRVDLVSGRGEKFRPGPGRLFAAARAMTFGQFAAAIDDAFGRWDLAHLHTVDLTDGTLLIGPGGTCDDPPQGRPVERSDRTKLSRLALAEQFVYTFEQPRGSHWYGLSRDRRASRERAFVIVATWPSAEARRC